MAGGIKKTEIVEADLNQLSEELHKVGEEISKLWELLSKKPKIDGLSDLNKATKETTASSKELAKQQKALADAEQKLIDKAAAKVSAQQRINDMLKEEGLTWDKVKAKMGDYMKVTGDMASAHKKMGEDWKKSEAYITKHTNAVTSQTQSITKNAQAIAAEERIKQSKIATDTKVVNLIKAEQQATNTETQARIKNAQAIAAEERAKQAGIRTSRLEQNEHTKTSSLFTRLAYSLRTYIAAYASFQSLMSAISSVFKQTKELDSLSFSMRTIIKDANELAQTQVFLSDTAKNYGLDLLSISERYIRFRAATIQSNMTAKDTQKIFDSVSKAASVLGLRTDETAGIYLALEQMISKGKVTTEELRRQLGERLPGAFGIMAKTMQVLHPEMNITLESLDDMLRKGKIISSEVLPEFANQIEIALGIKSVTTINNLAAAQGRLNTSWTEFVKSLEASKTFAGIFNILADSLQRVNNAIKSDANKTTERSVKLISESVDKLNEGATVQERQEILTKQILDLEQRRGKISAQLVKDESKRPGFLEKTVSGLNQALGLGGAFTSSIMFEQVYQDTVLDETAYKKAIDNLKKNFNKLVIPPIKTPKITGEDDKKGNKFTPLEQLQDQHKKQLEEMSQYQQELLSNIELSESQILQAKVDNAKELIRIRMDQIEEEKKLSTKEQISALNVEYSKEEKALAKSTADFVISEQKRLNKEIEDENKKLADEKKKAAEELSNKTVSDAESAIHNEAMLLYQKAKEDIDNAKNNAEKIKAIQDKLEADLIASEIRILEAKLKSGLIIGNDADQIQKRINSLKEQGAKKEIDTGIKAKEEKKALLKEELQATNEFLQQGLSFAQQIYSQQAARAQETYNAEMNAAGDSLEYQTLAKRKFEAEDKKIKQRQAIAEKLSAVLTAGLNLALAIGSPNIFTKPLQIASATLGLAMALATPIPQFAEGDENTPSTFIAGEEGNELIKTKSGKMILTPNKATLFSDNNLIGSTVFPHDQTQRMLANMAFSQVREVVDMSKTESHLASMDKQMKNKTERFTDSKGRTVVRRGNLVSTL